MNRTPWTLSGLLLLLALYIGACGDSLGSVADGELTIEPPQFVFDTVTLGEQQLRTVTLRNTGSGDLVIDQINLEVNSADIQMITSFAGQTTLVPQETLPIDLIYAPTSPILVEGHVTVISNDRERPDVQIPIVPPALSPVISVHPNPIEFGVVAEGDVNCVDVIVQNRGTAPLSISEITVEGSFDFDVPSLDSFVYPIGVDVYSGEGEPTEAERYLLEVCYQPPTPGPDAGEIHFSYNGRVESLHIVEVSGEAGLPALTVTPNPIDFGFTGVNTTKPINVTITNNGNLPLYLWEIYFQVQTSSAFEFVNLNPSFSNPLESLLLQPEGSVSFRVDYTPPEERSDSGRVSITHSNTESVVDTEVTPVAMAGIGVENQCPVAVAVGRVRGDPQLRRSTQIDWATPTDVLLLESGSFDPDGEIVEYQWEITRAPQGVTSLLEPLPGAEDDESKRQFFVPLSGTYIFTLRVYDDKGFESCEPAEVQVLALPDEHIHIELSWHNPLDPDEANDSGSDVDLHFVKVGYNWFDERYDTYFANDAPNWAPETPSLDIDDTDGAGPENVQMDDPANCQWYAVGVHYFKKAFGTAYTTVRIFIDAELIAEFNNRTLESTDDFWDVGRLHWPSGRFFAVDEIYGDFGSDTASPPAITTEMAEAGQASGCE